ncbi:benzoate 4-monooxygenase [Naviculisporaceae sp. PSN 640]
MAISKLFTTAILIWLTYKLVQWWKHPLRRFPGPFLASFTNAPFSWDFLRGRQPFRQLELHKKYGPVVRVAPNELSFSTASSWRDIYSIRKGVQPFIKGHFYEGAKFAGQVFSVVTERDPAIHAAMRRYLSPGFSDRSLRAQEVLISDCVDLMVKRIGEVGNEKGANGIDIGTWYHLASFDIIGSLAFGMDFEGLQKVEDHYWVAALMRSLTYGAMGDLFHRFPVLKKVVPLLVPGVLRKLSLAMERHADFTMQTVKRRLASQSDRPDFLTKIIDARDGGEDISDMQIAGHVSDFVIAGSETTSTVLACLTYHLVKQPALMEKLKAEVRSAFDKYAEIDATSTSRLKYLRGLCLEAMRVYPPLPLALPRLVPIGGATVDGHFIPEGVTVSTSPYAASMSPSNFKDPEKFDPERWLTEDPTDILDASQPFSYGTRACMGRSLGWMEMMTIMAKVIFMYDLEMVNKELDWHAESRMYTIWIRPELLVKVKPCGDETRLL